MYLLMCIFKYTHAYMHDPPPSGGRYYAGSDLPRWAASVGSDTKGGHGCRIRSGAGGGGGTPKD
jgi:hypothetical protein